MMLAVRKNRLFQQFTLLGYHMDCPYMLTKVTEEQLWRLSCGWWDLNLHCTKKDKIWKWVLFKNILSLDFNTEHVTIVILDLIWSIWSTNNCVLDDSNYPVFVFIIHCWIGLGTGVSWFITTIVLFHRFSMFCELCNIFEMITTVHYETFIFNIL